MHPAISPQSHLRRAVQIALADVDVAITADDLQAAAVRLQLAKDKLSAVQQTILHKPSTGRIKCVCGTWCSFSPGPLTHIQLFNGRREYGRKFGECPICGVTHTVPLSKAS
jgi:hypothetical protein